MSTDRSFSASWDESATTLTVLGDIETWNIDQLALALQRSEGPEVVVDLSATTFLPSQAMGVLVMAAKRARQAGGSVTFEAVEGSVASRVLAVAGLLHRG